MKSLGAIVIVLGIIMVTMTGFNIVTSKKVPEVGSIDINIKKEKLMPKKEFMPIIWSPVTGSVLILVGAVLVIVTGKGKKRVS